jgi:hypothetical protein
MKKQTQEKRELYLVKLKKYENELLKKLFTKKENGKRLE